MLVSGSVGLSIGFLKARGSPGTVGMYRDYYKTMFSYAPARATTRSLLCTTINGLGFRMWGGGRMSG